MMQSSTDFLIDFIEKQGIKYVIGVTCSFLGSLISACESSSHFSYITATQEGEALAIASGLF